MNDTTQSANDPTTVEYWRAQAQRHVPTAVREPSEETTPETMNTAEVEASAGVDDTDNVFALPMVPLDLDEAVQPEPLALFSVEHWLYLNKTGRVVDVPTQFAPFPLPLHTADQLENDLRQWELVDGDGRVSDELSALLDTLAFDHDVAVWGMTMFPRDTWTFSLDKDTAEEFGMAEHRAVVPRVPVFVVYNATRGEVVSAISTQAGLVMNRAFLSEKTHPADVLADELMSVVNPGGSWKAVQIPTVRLAGQDVAALRDVVIDKGLDQSEWDSDEFSRTLRGINPDLSDDTVTAMTSLSLAPTVATTTVVGHVRDVNTGEFAETTGSTGLQFYDLDTPSVVAVYSERDAYGQESVVYRPGGVDTLRRGLRNLLATATK